MDLYHRYGPALRRKCERMLHSQEDAEDVVQGVFADLFRRGLTEADLPYLYRAATTRALNVIRNRRRRRALLDRHGEALSPPAGPSEDRFVSRELLVRLVDTLDEAGAELFVYRWIDDLTQAEIADLTGISRKTIGRRLDDIRAALVSLEVGP